MARKSLLVDGQIPARTECPFVGVCTAKRDNYCRHRGEQHETAFRCLLASSFDRMQAPNPNTKNYDYCGSWKKRSAVPSDGV